MGLVAIWKKITYRKDDNTNYRALSQRAGEMTPSWDSRGIPGPMQGNPLDSQPQAGFANDHISAADPTWKGPR